MTKTYYTLATFDLDRKWTPEFGAYSRKEADDEARLMRDQLKFEGRRLPGRVVVVVKSGDTQAEINAAIALLNAA